MEPENKKGRNLDEFLRINAVGKVQRNPFPQRRYPCLLADGVVEKLEL